MVWITRDQLRRIFRPQEHARVVGGGQKKAFHFSRSQMRLKRSHNAPRGCSLRLSLITTASPRCNTASVTDQAEEASPWIPLARSCRLGLSGLGVGGQAAFVRVRMRREDHEASVHETGGELHPIEIGMNGWQCADDNRGRGRLGIVHCESCA